MLGAENAEPKSLGLKASQPNFNPSVNFLQTRTEAVPGVASAGAYCAPGAKLESILLETVCAKS